MRIIILKRDQGERRVLELEFAPNSFILLSGHKNERQCEGTDGPFDQLNITPIISFLYRNEETGSAVEWEIECGPIQIYTRAAEREEGAEPHYAWPFILPRGMDWSQLAVNREGLPSAFFHGDYEHIFAVLKRWSDR